MKGNMNSFWSPNLCIILLLAIETISILIYSTILPFERKTRNCKLIKSCD